MSIELKNVTYTYSQGTAYESHALKDINLVIPDGQFIGVIGHTGSGKSTLIQHFNALIQPTSGQILYNGEDVWFQYGLLPGETSWPTYTYSECAPGDSYAVYDIDNDGREELLFSLSGTTYVWEYRDSVLYEELRAFTYGLIIKCKNACRDAAGIFNCILAVFTC